MIVGILSWLWFDFNPLSIEALGGNVDPMLVSLPMQKAYDVLRAVVPEMKSNRSVYDDINKAYQLVLEEKFLADGE